MPVGYLSCLKYVKDSGLSSVEPEKLYAAPRAFARTCATLLRRFFASQYKRNCVPDGPKISLSLSPRGDWCMPSDVAFAE
jgi:hypothetical protein